MKRSLTRLTIGGIVYPILPCGAPIRTPPRPHTGELPSPEKGPTMRVRVANGALLAVLTLLAGQSVAKASLTPFYQFNGKGNWSIDGVGANTSPVGNISASVPLGSTAQ